MSGYACVICGTNFRSLSQSRFPDFYCSSCYEQWSTHENEPWLKDLIREETRKRVKKHRLKKSGINFKEVPLDSVVI